MGCNKILLEQGISIFEREFNVKPEVAAFAPGRVNLIGEHTDYNDGYVLPMALPMVTIILGKRFLGKLVTIVTANDDINEVKRVEIELPSNKQDLKPGMPKWANYVKGVIANYIGNVDGFQAVIISDVPTGGGLSSSASLEVATYTFLDALNGELSNSAVKPVEKALACQKAEHDYAGMPCGIMDQFISVMGQKNNALLIDCRSLTLELIPFTNENVTILITNSNVKHELTGSEYSSRRQQCHEAAKLMKKNSLRDAVIGDVANLQSENIDADIVKRARHVVSEIQRTKSASEALKANDMVVFGKLMLESHISLRDDFEVSCKELDQLVDLAMEVDGALGSRMTGGGFGGCTVTLVYKKAANDVIDHIKSNYKGKPTFYTCVPSDGASVIKNI